MKPLCPRYKRLKREGRLQAAKHWLPEYNGKKLQQQDDMLGYSDETFCFIAGYTSNGIPYGLTWEELQHEPEEFNEHNDSEELPF